MAGSSSIGSKMRVLFVNTATVPPLGADTWVHVQIMRELDRSTHELLAACATGSRESPTPTYRALRDIPDLEIRPVNFGPELAGRSLPGKLKALVATLPAVVSIARLAVEARRRRIRIVHTSDRPRDAFASILIAQLAGATSLVHVHVGYNAEWMGRMLRWSLAHADALVAISDYVAGTLIEGGHRADRIHVVRNAIDVTRWVPGAGRDAVRTEFGLTDATGVITTVCRLFPEKGPADLIRAVDILRKDVPDVMLLIVGQPMDPAYLGVLTDLVRDLDLDDHVRFLGRREDVGAVMAAADVFAMPSFEEPFGLVFLEAMAMQLPVVALASGGTLEVVEHGKSGLLSDRGDLPLLAEHLRRLLNDPALRAEMGEYGRNQVESRFTVARMVQDIARVYVAVALSTDGSGRASRE